MRTTTSVSALLLVRYIARSPAHTSSEHANSRHGHDDAYDLSGHDESKTLIQLRVTNRV